MYSPVGREIEPGGEGDTARWGGRYRPVWREIQPDGEGKYSPVGREI